MECPICYECIDDTFITIGCCKKVFHPQCYNDCMLYKHECPMCRAFQHDISLPVKNVSIVIRERHLSVHKRMLYLYGGVYLGWSIAADAYNIFSFIFASTMVGFIFLLDRPAV